MLALSVQSRLVTKIIASPSGERYRAVFLASLVDGRWRGRLISIEPVSAGAIEGASTAPTGTDRLCLPCVNSSDIEEGIVSPYQPVLSPFLSLIGFIIHSQPTRAPSFV